MSNAPYIIDSEGQRIASDEMKKLTFTKGAKPLVAPQLAAAKSIPAVEWEPPETFAKETVVKDRNFRNTSGAEQAVGLNGAKVSFQNCKFLSNSSTSVMSWGGSSPKFEGCEFYGDPAPGQQYAKINVWQPKSFIMEHCKFEHTGGLLIEQWQGPLDAPLLIRYNKSLNVDKRRGDGSTGDHRAFIQLSTIRGLSQCEIAWNESINEPGKSYIEDNINIFNSRGASVEKPFLIHDNYIDGAYPFDLVTHFTGSGITVDGTPDVTSDDMMSAFILAYENHVVRCCNAAMNIAAGHDVHFYNNGMISSGAFPDGTKSNLFWGACCIWNASNAGANFNNNDIKKNRIGYARPDQNIPLPGRNDYVTVNNDVRITPTDNTHLPNPITKETEDNERVLWLKKVAANNYVIGPGVNGTPPVTLPSVTMKLGQKATGKIAPIDKDGKPVTFAAKDLKFITNAPTIFTVVASGNDFVVNPVKVGEGTGTVTLTTASGKTITKQFTVKIVAADAPTSSNEAVDFSITFTIS